MWLEEKETQLRMEEFSEQLSLGSGFALNPLLTMANLWGAAEMFGWRSILKVFERHQVLENGTATFSWQFIYLEKTIGGSPCYRYDYILNYPTCRRSLKF